MWLAKLRLTLGSPAGLKRRSSSFNHPRLEHIMEKGEYCGTVGCVGREGEDSSCSC